MDTASEYWIAGIAGWIACGVAGVLVGFRREADIEGFFYGCLFGPLGVIMAMRLDRRPCCPQCNEHITRAPPIDGSPTRTSVCPRCGRDIDWSWVNGHFTPRPYLEKCWSYELHGQTIGPVSWDELAKAVERGTVTHDTYVIDRNGTWMRAKHVKGLFRKPQQSG